MHKLWDQYYKAMAHSMLQSSLEEETFTRFRGHFVTMLGGHKRQSKSSVASVGIDVTQGIYVQTCMLYMGPTRPLTLGNCAFLYHF